jgi:hypothetical protein
VSNPARAGLISGRAERRAVFIMLMRPRGQQMDVVCVRRGELQPISTMRVPADIYMNVHGHYRRIPKDQPLYSVDLRVRIALQ